jgi:septal ring factor EnvC (AmiA/AmiB activator)
MWPKAIFSLIELAPHITRLVPLADRFFQSKSADAEASRSAMEQMAAGLRGDLGQVTASHAGLYRQLNDQSEKLSTIAADVHASRLTADALEARLAHLEEQHSQLWLMVAGALLLLVVISIVSILILVRHH